MAWIERLLSAKYIKKLVEKKTKPHKKVSGTLKQGLPGFESLFEGRVMGYGATDFRHATRRYSFPVPLLIYSLSSFHFLNRFILYSKYKRLVQRTDN